MISTLGLVADVSSMYGMSTSVPVCIDPGLSLCRPDTLILRLPVTTPAPVLPPPDPPPSFFTPLAGGLDTDSLDPDLTPPVLWLFSRLSRNLNHPPPAPFSLLCDSASDPRLLVLPRPSSSFFLNLKHVKIRTRFFSSHHTTKKGMKG